MPPSKKKTTAPLPSAPASKKLRTTKKPLPNLVEDDLAFSASVPSASASALAPSRGKNVATTAKDFSTPQRMNDAESSFFGTDDSAMGIAPDENDEIDYLVAAGFPDLPDEDVAEVELTVDDDDLDITNDSSKKISFYEALGLPIAAEDNPAETLLDILLGEHDIKQQVVSFARTCMISDRDISPLPTDDFLSQPQPSTWETQDPVSDVLWDTWLSECRELGVPDDTLNNAAKISGPARGNLNIVWHYPTHKTGRAIFGFTADPKNPCLQFQSRKIGPNPRVCTNDIIPIRANYVSSSSTGVQWTSLLPNSAQVLERSVDLTMGLLNMSRVTVLVGQEAYEMTKTRLESDSSKELHKLYLPIDIFTVFGEKPHVLVVMCKSTQQVESLIFVTFHTQSFFHVYNPTVGLYFDFLWNAACGIARIPILGHDTFYRTVSSGKVKDKVTGKWGQLSLAIMYRGMEKGSSVYLPESIALQIFHPTIISNSDWWAANFPNKGKTSVVQLVLKLFTGKAHETMRAQGFPNLARGRETQRAGGWQSLKKATETQKSTGFENLKTSAQAAGHVSQKAQKVSRIVAFLDTYQVRQLLSKPKDKLTSKESSVVQHLTGLRACVSTQETTEPCRKFLNTHAIFWSKKNPFGIRFDGDNAPPDAPSPSTYAHSEHPCVSLDSQLKPSHKDFARKGTST